MHFSVFPDRSTLLDWRGWLPTATEVVLVLALALQAARIVWVFLAPAEPAVTAVADGAGRPATPTADADAVQSSPDFVDVFFRTAASSTSAGEAMGYRLFGVRRDGDGGSAILGMDGRQASYPVGGEVAPGIVLESVGDDHAVVLAGSGRHRLELPGRSAAAAMTPRPAAGRARTTVPSAARSATAVPRTGAGSGTAQVKPPAPAPTPAQSAPAIDIRKLVAESGLRPNLAGGFTLSPSGDSALLKQAGLASGDVLLAVDGKPLNLASVAGLAGELEGRSQVEIRYRRNGQVHTTTLKAPR